MNPDQVHDALQARMAELKAAAAASDPAPLQRVARQVASQVREIAGREGHVISIRVIERPNGVRITVTGRYASRYRKMVEDRLGKLVPDAAVEIRTQITTQKAR